MKFMLLFLYKDVILYRKELQKVYHIFKWSIQIIISVLE